MIIKEMLEERNMKYGNFTEHAQITQAIKRIMKNSQNWDTMPMDMHEALDMIAHKIGRILNGDYNYIDSWQDIAGYVILIINRLKSELQDVKFNGTFHKRIKDEPQPWIETKE